MQHLIRKYWRLELSESAELWKVISQADFHITDVSQQVESEYSWGVCLLLYLISPMLLLNHQTFMSVLHNICARVTAFQRTEEFKTLSTDLKNYFGSKWLICSLCIPFEKCLAIILISYFSHLTVKSVYSKHESGINTVCLGHVTA